MAASTTATTTTNARESFFVDVGPIDIIKIDKFKEMSEISDAHFEQWLCAKEEEVTIPRFTQAAPARGYLAFGAPKIAAAAAAANGLKEVSCRMVVPRMDEIAMHFGRDLVPMLRDLRALRRFATSDRELFEAVCIRRFIEAALRFEMMNGALLLVDESETMRIRFAVKETMHNNEDYIQEKIYSLAGERLDRVCAGCGIVSIGLRGCACRAGVYYCSRECQVAHWPEHRRHCDRAAGGV